MMECDKPQSKSNIMGRTRNSSKNRTGTALVLVVASLIISTVAWLCLIFSGTTTTTTTHCLHKLVMSLNINKPTTKTNNKNNIMDISEQDTSPNATNSKTTLKISEIVFGIAGSTQLWEKRKEFVKLWWRAHQMRGHVWLEEYPILPFSSPDLPSIKVSEDTSSFRYTNPTGHPSGLRIARIVVESFRLGLPGVRWFVLGDDDTVFNVENLVGVLGKYDDREMVYVGGSSESHSANVYFSHNMAYGGGGIAVSYPLAEALCGLLDECLERYHMLYGSDDRLHACISELGVPLSREPGFHQWDIRGNAHGLLSSHPIAPFVSIHHVEAVDPFYPGLSSVDSLKLFTKAMNVDPMSFLQRSICYDHSEHLSFSVSLGYVVQVFPNIMPPRMLDRSQLTHSAWNYISQLNEFDLDMRETPKSICKRPILFFLKDVERRGNLTSGSYSRDRSKDDLKRKILCFPHSPPLPNVKHIEVVVFPLGKNWHLAPRRLCCRLNQTSDQLLSISVGQCQKGSLGAITDSF